MFKLEYDTSLVDTRTTRRSVREYDDYSAAERVTIYGYNTAQKTMATRRTQRRLYVCLSNLRRSYGHAAYLTEFITRRYREQCRS